MSELFARAESIETAAAVTVASGSRIFVDGVRQLPITGRLRECGAESDENERAILTRVQELAEEPIDLRYCHPHDVPLAIYLYVLYQLNRRVARRAAGAVLMAPNCSWAERVACGIRDEAERASEADIGREPSCRIHP